MNELLITQLDIYVIIAESQRVYYFKERMVNHELVLAPIKDDIQRNWEVN